MLELSGVKPKDLQQVDVVITVGLGRDDNNFLAEYKENNPNGKIVAINMSQPEYLGEGDMLLEGDLQEVVRQFEDELEKTRRNRE